MEKFKVGDKVKLIDDFLCRESYNGMITHSWMRFNDTLTVKEIEPKTYENTVLLSNELYYGVDSLIKVEGGGN